MNLRILQLALMTAFAFTTSTGFAVIAPTECIAADLYTQHKNVVYAEQYGVGLVMDVFVPTAERKNGHGIVDVASGAWYSSRSKIRDHKRAQVYDRMCGKGFTVFAVRPGSITRFSALDMLKHLNLSIVWVKQHADEYDIAPNELGLMGASAGGHLACLAAVTANEETRVKSIAVFFPPTDFLMYGKRKVDPRGKDRFDGIVRRLAFPDGVGEMTEEEQVAAITAISPARLVTEDAPPFLLIHGDADQSVPLQQSEKMVAALKAKGVPVELIVKPGGGHPWPTISKEVGIMADWFQKQLIEK